MLPEESSEKLEARRIAPKGQRSDDCDDHDREIKGAEI